MKHKNSCTFVVKQGKFISLFFKSLIESMANNKNSSKKTKSKNGEVKEKKDTKDKKAGITIFEDNIKKIEEENNIITKNDAKEDKKSKSFMIKLVLIGDGAVGKTSIRRRYLGEGFQKEHLATLGADFAVKDKVVNSHTIKYQIWDIAGQEFFKRVRSRFYKGCFGALAVFDITRKDTFINLTKWLDELYAHNGRGVVPVIVLANKSDLDEKEITVEEVEKYIEQLNEQTKPHKIENFFLKTSAKTGLNIDEAFEIIGKYIVSKFA